jgi:hypothetical protein
MSAPLPNLSGGAFDAALIVPSPALTGELIARLGTESTVGGRVVRQLASGRYLVSLGGVQVQAESRLALSAGDRLLLAVKEAGNRIVLDLISREAGPSPASTAEGTPKANAPLPASLDTRTPPGSSDSQTAAEASRLVRAEAGAALTRSDSPAELLGEVRRALALATGSAPAASALPPEAAARASGILEALHLAIVDVPASGLAMGDSAPDVTGLRAALEAAPQALLELISLVEVAAERILAEIPGIAALGTLIDLLEALPSPAGTAEQTVAALPPEVRAQLAEILDRLLAELSSPRGSAAAERGEIPADVRAQVESLSATERRALLELAGAREKEILASTPRLAGLSRAHRALIGLHQRAILSRLGSLAGSGPSSSFCYFELPVAAGGDPGVARVRVSVRRRAGDAGREPPDRDAPGGRTARAVLDLRTSGLGEVWSEALLSGRNIAVRLQLPDAARRDFVAAGLHQLEERLAAHGLQPAVSAVARERSGASPSPQAWPEASADGRIDLWV